MKIQSINSQNIISSYGNNIGMNVDKVEKVKAKDTIEISAVGKALNSYSISDINFNSITNVAHIKNNVQNGMYNIDATVTAQSIIDNIRGRKV